MTKPRRAAIAAIALALIWLYRRSLSPAFYAMGVRCRHEPSCSEYAAEAFRRHGAWRGFWLALSRLCRCHPLGSWGFDPVPESRLAAGWRFWRHGDWAWTERGAKEPDGQTATAPSSRTAA